MLKAGVDLVARPPRNYAEVSSNATVSSVFGLKVMY